MATRLRKLVINEVSLLVRLEQTSMRMSQFGRALR